MMYINHNSLIHSIISMDLKALHFHFDANALKMGT